MEPHGPQFGGGATGNILHPAVLVLALLATILFFVLPRKYVIVPVLVTTFLIPLGQQFYIGGVHLFVYRILTLLAFTRVLFSRAGQKSLYAGGWMSIDTAFTCYVLISATATMIQFPSGAAFVNQVGYLWDYLLGYLLLRALIRTEQDSYVVIKCCAGLMVILAVCMTIEQFKLINVFGLLGGVSPVPEVREGKIRSQAVFQHALTAGTFSAAALPLFYLLWRSRKAKLMAIVGIAAATVMTVDTQTSTSLITYAGAILGICFWPMRKKMRIICWGLMAAVIGLHLIMKAPVWFLIARIDLTGSSSSYHRAALIDQFVNHFSSWWLIGTKDAATWGWDMWDAQNMYVSVGESGGLAALVCYVLVIWRVFARIGDARKRATDRNQEWFLWLLGAAMFANVVAFFGVNYFDQVRMAWFALIAMVCATSTPLFRRQNSVKDSGTGTQLQIVAPLSESVLEPEPEPVESVSRYLFS
jgi:hypothetical protein